VPGLLTVKMRIGFEDDQHFERILDIVNSSGVDLLTVHGRTVRDLYRGGVRYDRIAHAAARSRCPVLANGNATSARRAAEIVGETRCAGVMIGRHAIRNPWIFRQCRERFGGLAEHRVTLGEVRGYVERLYRETRREGVPERYQVSRMKKYLNFVGQGVDPRGDFLRDMRRAASSGCAIATCSPRRTRRSPPSPTPGSSPGPTASRRTPATSSRRRRRRRPLRRPWAIRAPAPSGRPPRSSSGSTPGPRRCGPWPARRSEAPRSSGGRPRRSRDPCRNPGPSASS